MAVFIFCIAMVVLGIIGMVWADSRDFNRTNEFGVREYKGYFSALMWQFIEGVIGFVSFLIVGFGIGFTIFAWAFMK